MTHDLATEGQYDRADRARLDELREELWRREERLSAEIAEAEAAQARYAAGTYGRCEGCGGEIAQARLEALPATRFCIHCQEEREAEARPATPIRGRSRPTAVGSPFCGARRPQTTDPDLLPLPERSIKR